MLHLKKQMKEIGEGPMFGAEGSVGRARSACPHRPSYLLCPHSKNKGHSLEVPLYHIPPLKKKKPLKSPLLKSGFCMC